MVFPIAGGTQDTGYEISNSLRFNDDDSAKLGKDFSTTETSDKTKTLSFWIKRSTLGQEGLIRARTDSEDENTRTIIYFASNDTLQVQSRVSGSGATLSTNRVFRDVSAWYHLVIAFDTSQGTASNRLKIYVNGVEETSFGTDERSSITQNREIQFGNNKSSAESFIGNEVSDLGFYDGYISEFNFIDGQQLDASYFGETNDNGVWVPKQYTGTYGNNGFFLEFKQTGTSQNSSGIGADTSGNDNHFASTNLAATDVTEDTPTNNFCTLNPLSAGSDIRANGSFKEGNCELVNGGTTGESSGQRCQGTMGFANGKWYWEVKLISNTMTAGIIDSNIQTTSSVSFSGKNAVRYNSETGEVVNASGTVYTGSTYDDGDIISVAVDADNGYVYFAKNGTYQNSGDPASGSSGTGGASFTTGDFMLPLATDNSSGSAGNHQYNFGNPPHSISSGNSDANGYGNFEYSVPSGYHAICAKNLAEYG